jgi:hypothetical protein
MAIQKPGMERGTCRAKIMNIWRVINFLILLSSFWGPWGPTFGDVVFGYQWLLMWVGAYTFLEFRAPLAAVLLGGWYPFLWFAMSAYWIANMGRALGKITRTKSGFLIIPLIAAFLFLSLDMYPRIFHDPLNRFWNVRIYWGYWLLILGVISPIGCEVVDFLGRRRAARAANN